MSRPFNDVMAEIAGGRAHDELTDKLMQLAAEVQELESPGTLTLTLKLKPNGESQFEIHHDIKVKPPEPRRPKTIMFLDGHGSLTRRDPNQPDLPLRDVTETKFRDLDEREEANG